MVGMGSGEMARNDLPAGGAPQPDVGDDASVLHEILERALTRAPEEKVLDEKRGNLRRRGAGLPRSTGRLFWCGHESSVGEFTDLTRLPRGAALG